MNLRILSNPRALWFGWIGLIPVALLLAVMLLVWLPQAAYKGRTVYGERIKLQLQLDEIEKEMKRDLERYTDILKRFPWIIEGDRKSTRLNSSHIQKSRMPSSA